MSCIISIPLRFDICKKEELDCMIEMLIFGNYGNCGTKSKLTNKSDF